MARTGTTHPEPRMRELREKRAQVQAELAQVGATVRDAKAELRQVPGRERQALLAQELGRDGESVETIVQEADRWRRQIAAGEPRLQALSDADQQLAAEQLAVVDENPMFYLARATVASERAETALDRAMQAIAEAQRSWQEAEMKWQVVRASKMRHGEGEQAHVPSPDFGQVVFRLSQITEVAPWPGGSHPGEDEEAKAA